ncbi:MAG TPA: hypothetical protein GXX75_08690 [Clostridiales bacterium]|nr:hypothetical protein [Clostridiales bacterium]
MLGFVYLILCFLAGWVICTYAFPGLSKIVEKDYKKRNISVSPFLLLFPAWFATGTLALTWATYLVAYLFGARAEPLYYANLIVMPLAAGLSVLGVLGKARAVKQNGSFLLTKDKKRAWLEIILAAGIILLGSILMWTTFFVSGDKLYIGVSVFSDFSPHIGMIRSFSYGNNFPTSYSHFGGEDIKYHFMFQFLVGNLEYLGMRLDYAFNLPSILSFAGAFFLLYLLAVKITGKPPAGVLACLFFAFRSAGALFTYLAGLPEGTNILQALMDNTSFLSDTPNEDWGLWNLNVYCNQRHLAFGLTVIFLVIILLMPHVYEMFEALKQYNFPGAGGKKGQKGSRQKGWARVAEAFFTKDGWAPENMGRAIATGVLLGSLGFFHGAAVIGCLSVLFVMAIMSKRRCEFIIVAAITLALTICQTHFFINGSVVKTELYFGFIAENKTIFGVASYLERLLGILPFVLLAAFCLEKGVERFLILAFSAPLVLAFTVSLTVDVTVNHKYIMMSCILLGIFAALLVARLFERKDVLLGMAGVLLVLCLTATGIYDFITVLKKNTPSSAVVLDLEDPLTKWVEEHSESKDLFLTSNYAVNQIVLGGAMLYEGWQYFPWSAGYDTDYRTAQVKLMYEADTPGELEALVKKNSIRYIVVDQDNRNSQDYIVNEENIKNTYECVYYEGEGDYRTSIYDTWKPVY